MGDEIKFLFDKVKSYLENLELKELKENAKKRMAFI
jgi:hypothetical protein